MVVGLQRWSTQDSTDCCSDGVLGIGVLAQKSTALIGRLYLPGALDVQSWSVSSPFGRWRPPHHQQRQVSDGNGLETTELLPLKLEV